MDYYRELPYIALSEKDTLRWSVPQKKILCESDIQLFQKSQSMININAMVALICDKVSLVDVPLKFLDANLVDFDKKMKGPSKSEVTKIDRPPKFDSPTPVTVKPITNSILDLLDSLTVLKEETPPFEGPRRYGNLACRDWHAKVSGKIDEILSNSLRNHVKCAGSTNSETCFEGFIKEIRYYLLQSFGSRDRLDYGTGHELSFVAFLGCLTMANLIDRYDMPGTEWLMILAKYYDLVKSLILTYTLEPAGSHGVWGLDDHFHLIYVFGACQLVNFKELSNDAVQTEAVEKNNLFKSGVSSTPSSVLNLGILREQRTKNLYYNAISFIMTVKSGPFREHSPLLYEISATKSWGKVAKGMLKMFYVEVLSKFPVVQHFYFGSVFYPWVGANGDPLKPTSPGSAEQHNSNKETKNTRNTNIPTTFVRYPATKVSHSNVSSRIGTQPSRTNARYPFRTRLNLNLRNPQTETSHELEKQEE